MVGAGLSTEGGAQHANVPVLGDVIDDAAREQHRTEAAVDAAAVTIGELVALPLAGNAPGQPPRPRRVPVGMAGDDVGTGAHVLAGAVDHFTVQQGQPAFVAFELVLVAHQRIDPVAVGVAVGQAQLEAVLQHVATFFVVGRQQVVAAQQGPVAAQLACHHELQQRGVERLVGIGVRHVLGDAVLHADGAAPQRVGTVVQRQRQAGAVAGVAVDHVDPFRRAAQAQAFADVPVVADTRGGLHVTATDGITQAVFGERLGVAQVGAVHTEHQRIGLAVGGSDAVGAGQAGLLFVAAIQAAALEGLVVHAGGNAVALFATDALLDLRAAAELLAEAVAHADARAVRLQLGAHRQVAGDDAARGRAVDDHQAGGRVQRLLAVAQRAATAAGGEAAGEAAQLPERRTRGPRRGHADGLAHAAQAEVHGQPLGGTHAHAGTAGLALAAIGVAVLAAQAFDVQLHARGERIAQPCVVLATAAVQRRGRVVERRISARGEQAGVELVAVMGELDAPRIAFHFAGDVLQAL